ncbi:MAG TPA: hypothetical protein VF173_10405 [Thermoanaerobaculia bacterium]|nr:hypothetical protein [Thermoanaerobaculia bacterium]
MSASGSSLLVDLQGLANQNVFVMMRYRQTHHFAEIEACIRDTLREFSLTARLAKDGALVESLWSNIELYMKYSRFGVAVFEDIEERDFNPNIPFELGYMFALGKRCLILKERRMPRLPTDMLGLVYRDFDVFDLQNSLRRQIRSWCIEDLGMRPPQSSAQREPLELVFDNQAEDPEFRTWGRFSTIGAFHHINLTYNNACEEGSLHPPVLELTANGSESLGINRPFTYLCGKARFDYKALSSGATNPNLLFCMIPMRGKLSELLEVGAQHCDEPANAYSPYRLRYFVPEVYIGDDTWHTAEIDFDFQNVPTASYSIFAPRINEGCPRPGPGQLQIRRIELYAPKVNSSASMLDHGC